MAVGVVYMQISNPPQSQFPLHELPYSYNSEFISLSVSNAISVMGMRQKEWKMLQSQPAALGPLPAQGFGHPRKSWLAGGQAR